VNKREATTETLITNGQTVVIGGLRERNVVQQISKVPLLGDLPLLKALFSYKGEKIVNSELVVFITPYIVSDASVLSGREAKRLVESEKELREPEAPSTTLDSREDESD
jgi:type II secretory pathway component GspD/PulD (secretin)